MHFNGLMLQVANRGFKVVLSWRQYSATNQSSGIFSDVSHFDQLSMNKRVFLAWWASNYLIINVIFGVTTSSWRSRIRYRYRSYRTSLSCVQWWCFPRSARFGFLRRHAEVCINMWFKIKHPQMGFDNVKRQLLPLKHAAFKYFTLTKVLMADQSAKPWSPTEESGLCPE